MSKILNNCFPKLNFIAKIKDPKLRKKLLASLADNCLFQALHEIAVNTVKGTVPLNKSQKRRLAKHKNVINKLAKIQSSKKRKLILIKQSGGFLPIILPAIATVLSTLLK